MNTEEKKQRITELTELLSRAARAYEQEDREIISNFEYDRLYDELKALEDETGIVLAGSPTHSVGYEVLSELPKERHASPMLSLNKTKSREELASWLNGHTGVLSWKMDGLTIVLTYSNGELVKAVTRGNGEIGEVITPNAKVFKNVPLRIAYKGDLVLRGEAVIRYSDFEKINASIPEADAKYKNPRNLCSGSVRQLDSSVTAKRSVYLYAFALISMSEPVVPDASDSTALTGGFRYRHEQLDYLAELGFDVVERSLVNSGNVADHVENFSKKIATNDFPSDGLVLIYDDIAYGQSLGRTAKFPRDGIAFKWADEEAETTLLEIEWSPSRTGLINPVAIFEPVELEGTTVSRASVHNVSIVEELALGIGDRIKVYKANMIIPQISENLTRSGSVTPPEICPVCGSPTSVHDENGVRTLYCENPSCAAKQLGLFTHMAARDAMNIDGLSEATIEKLIGEGLIHSMPDFFRLKEHADRIASMEGFKEKSRDNLLAAIETARTTTLARLVYSLGIPNIGLANAKVICRYISDDPERIPQLGMEELMSIEGIGEVLARSFTDYFADEKNLAMYRELLSLLTFEKEEAASAELEGKVFVITGSVEHFANRNELKDFIEARGGKVTGSVTAKTSYLINNDITSGSSKNKTAKELGVPLLKHHRAVDDAE
ncbi:MAG: NAD-dependent DNA ligase LigA, partial [Lachnospiraceae bacterium]|nr:NAD-dependent DNA ligase LigA [Lachnospiraceae bacterium]